MAWLDVHAFSEALGRQTAFHVLLPQAVSRQIGMNSAAHCGAHPVLWLLHGLSDDHTIWLRRTGIERYAAARGLAVVMPAAGRSYYQDMVYGPAYWTFISEELPALCRAWFPMSPAREDNFAAGLSMGGYGALRLALAHPSRFAAGASLSGALDLARRLRAPARPGSRISPTEWHSIFGPDLSLAPPAADLWHLAATLAQTGEPGPALSLCCGTEDELLGETRAFREHLLRAGLGCDYHESPGGHDWAYWDREIARIIDWLPIQPSAPR
jgi:S-formylglutathione hydrolase FrmB